MPGLCSTPNSLGAHCILPSSCLPGYLEELYFWISLVAGLRSNGLIGGMKLCHHWLLQIALHVAQSLSPLSPCLPGSMAQREK